MISCPFPHSSRDQVWLLIGALFGIGLTKIASFEKFRCPFIKFSDSIGVQCSDNSNGVTTPRVLRSQRVIGTYTYNVATRGINFGLGCVVFSFGNFGQVNK